MGAPAWGSRGNGDRPRLLRMTPLRHSFAAPATPPVTPPHTHDYASDADTNKKGNSSLPCLHFVMLEQTRHVNEFHIPYVVLIYYTHKPCNVIIVHLTKGMVLIGTTKYIASYLQILSMWFFRGKLERQSFAKVEKTSPSMLKAATWIRES